MTYYDQLISRLRSLVETPPLPPRFFKYQDVFEKKTVTNKT